MREVPDMLAVRGRVVEVRERGAQARRRRAEVAQQSECERHVREKSARPKGQQPNCVLTLDA